MQRNFQLKTADRKTNRAAIIDLPYTTARYAYQCFPVRNPNFTNDGGAWLVEYKASRNTNSKENSCSYPPKKRKTKDLTGFFIVKNCYVNTPDDICILNLSGRNLSSIENEDFGLFKNVVHIDASDNLLTLESFKTFPSLKHLELQVNGISSVKLSHRDFLPLETLDLSYNSLSHDALLTLGKLRSLCDLSLRGCSLKSLPAELARGYQVAENDVNQKKEKAEEKTRFPCLSTLDLSENSLTDISTFASVAGLRKLQRLNLSCNKISSVPHLRLMAAHRHFSFSTCADVNSHTAIQCGLSDHSDGSEKVSSNNADDARKQTSRKENSPMESTEQLREEDGDEEEEQEESGDEDSKDDLIDGLEDAISRISSTKATGGGGDVDATDTLLNIDFAEELNFRLDELDVDENFLDDDLRCKATAPVGGIDDTNEKRVTGTPIITKQDYSPNLHQTFSEHSASNLLDDDLKQPFTSLLSIDLSYNHIQNEESLLALATWPSLNELKLWGNPLMRSNKGIPPVLHHHLKVLCGINIIRKEPRPLPRHLPCAPTLASSAKARKVKDDLPPIKRNNILAIENMILQAIENKYGGDSGEPGEQSEAGPIQHDVDDSKGEDLKQDNNDTFFLTQVDEEGISCAKENAKEIDELTDQFHAGNAFGSDERSLVDYLDINSLLEVNEGEETAGDLAVPDSVQGSVIALRHMLRNELVFKSGHYNRAKQKLLPKVKKEAPTTTLRENSIERALHNIQTIENGHQENLEFVLENFDDDVEIQQKFPDAKQMLTRVQKKYDKVRSRSLRPISETQHKLKQYSTRADYTPQELVLSRMRKGNIGQMFSPSRGNTPRVQVRGTRYDIAISQ